MCFVYKTKTPLHKNHEVTLQRCLEVEPLPGATMAGRGHVDLVVSLPGEWLVAG